MNLKRILMDLGNELVKQGYRPAQEATLRTMRAAHRDSWSGCKPYSTTDVRPQCVAGGLECLVLLTEWLNACPEARKVLADMGIEWPVVERDGVGSGPADPRDVLDALTADQIAEVFDTMDPRDRVYCVHGWADVAALEHVWRRRREQR
jgi:hypothetical protein